MQKIILGTPKKLVDCFQSLNITNYLLVCDKFCVGTNVYNELLSIKPYSAIFTEFLPNPVYEDVIAGVDIFKGRKCDGIIALGGGSTIDVAKCIKLFSGLDRDKNYLTQTPFIDSRIPLLAIPTTAGTGSESTRFAVIYYNSKKQSITNNSIIPDIVLLDFEVLTTLPLYQKKCTLLDALCQAIESWWSVNSTQESIVFAEKAIKLILENYKKYIFESSSDAMKQIMLGANYAGRAINITQTTAAHAMSYKLTSKYKLPHGHAVAICLPTTWRYIESNRKDTVDGKGYHELLNKTNQIAQAMGEKDSVQAIKRFESIMCELGIKAPKCTSIDDLNDLVQSVNPIRLKNYPVLISKEIMTEMYKEILSFQEIQ